MYSVGAFVLAAGSTSPTSSDISVLKPTAVALEVIAGTARSQYRRFVVPPSTDIQNLITFAVPAPIAFTSVTITLSILFPLPSAAATAGPEQRVVVVVGEDLLVSVLATE